MSDGGGAPAVQPVVHPPRHPQGATQWLVLSVQSTNGASAADHRPRENALAAVLSAIVALATALERTQPGLPLSQLQIYFNAIYFISDITLPRVVLQLLTDAVGLHLVCWI